jgi:hypothetical protein
MSDKGTILGILIDNLPLWRARESEAGRVGWA